MQQVGLKLLAPKQKNNSIDSSKNVSHIYIVAGEPSGDLLAAALAKAIFASNTNRLVAKSADDGMQGAPERKTEAYTLVSNDLSTGATQQTTTAVGLCKQSNIFIAGVGGLHMRSASVVVEEDMDILSIVGLSEVIKDLWQIISLMHRVKRRLLINKPDILVLVDAPGFNLRLAKWAHKQGIKILYLVSPQIWAWKHRRIKTIKRVVNFMAVLLPFEVELYNRHGVSNLLIKHPLYTAAKVPVVMEDVMIKFALNPGDPILVLMPGSRKDEIRRHLELMYAAYKILKNKIPGLQCICLRAANLAESQYDAILSDSTVKLIVANNHEVLSVATAAIVASGTATLEVALHKVPMVVIYKTSNFTYQACKFFVKVPYISLCNWVLGSQVVPELIQDVATIDNIVTTVLPLLSDDVVRKRMCDSFAEIDNKFAAAGSMDDLAKSLLSGF